VRLALLGVPGAGKGTQAKRLTERYGLRHIATGDILRDNLTRGTELGLLARTYMDAGELVPDDVVVRMVCDALDASPSGFVLDGFPRTVPQAEALERRLAERGTPLDGVLALDLPDEVAVKRLAGRRTCAGCQRPYNVELDATAVPGVCDRCGGRLVQREDDREETVRRRLEVYYESTAPLRDFYASRGLLRPIDADATEDEVTARAVAALGQTLADQGRREVGRR
jgi:adenylate kinase